MKQFVKNVVDRLLVERIARRTAEQVSIEVERIARRTAKKRSAEIKRIARRTAQQLSLEAEQIAQRAAQQVLIEVERSAQHTVQQLSIEAERIAQRTTQQVLIEVERSAQRTAHEFTEARSESRNTVNHVRLNSLLDSAPNGVPPSRLFATIDDDFWLWLHTEGHRRSNALRRILPGLPAEETQRLSVGAVGDAAIKLGFAASKVFRKIYEQTRGRPLTPDTSVLDFGCGWGRIARFFLKDIDPSRLHGTDASEGMVAFCRQAFRWGTFSLNDHVPPTKFEPGTFDLIYALSVFSHLSEDVHRQWLAEFKRILVPGGVLIATTWGRDFITYCRDSRERTDLTSTTRHLPGLFVDTNDALSRYDTGGFCFDTSPEIYGKWSDWHGETCISQRYVRMHWPEYFEHLDYVDEGADRDVFGQNIIVGRTASA